MFFLYSVPKMSLTCYYKLALLPRNVAATIVTVFINVT